jgi:hypothetical protein
MIFYLYLKTHNKTGLKYLGKTTRVDPYLYKGSGKYWSRHIAVYGYNVTTEILFETESKKELKEKGIYYSNLWNIVDNPNFANLRIEMGDGGDTMTGHPDLEKIIKKNRDRKATFKWWNNGKTQCHSSSPPDDTYSAGRLPFNNIGSKIGAEINKNKKWINDGKNQIMIDKDQQLPNGYLFGRLPSPKKGKPNLTAKGVKWWNNGSKSIMAMIPPDNTYILGRLIKPQ